jgi:hypothetical protein
MGTCIRQPGLFLGFALLAGACGSSSPAPVAPTMPSPVQYVFTTEASGNVAPPVKIEAGDYTLTLVADSACTDIPSDLRTRTYAATITPAKPSSGLSPNTHYDVAVSGSSLSPFGFGIGVAGNYLRFEIDGPAFFEHLPSFTYLEIAGSGGTFAETSAMSSISIPFSGSFEYCVLKSGMGRSNNCYTTPADQKVTYAQCLSKNDRMILMRR